MISGIHGTTIRSVHFLLLSTLFIVLLGILAAPWGCAEDPIPSEHGAVPFAKDDPMRPLALHLPGPSSQAILVMAEEADTSKARVGLYERSGDGWSPLLPPFNGVTGRKGIAKAGAKREGDGATPSGIYPLELVFGYPASVDTKMPYRQATRQDIWVDDVNSPDYNRWVARGSTSASSYEEMRRNDNLYKYGVVIGYNANPVVKGLGSAIFLHIWKNRDTPTSGCVALAEEDLRKIIAWLDPKKRPVIVISGKDRTR